MGVGSYHIASGNIVYPWICIDCNTRSTNYVSKRDLSFFAADLIDVVHYSKHLKSCEVCGDAGAELHHYAPQYLFDDADKWPTGYLCIPCHIKWHKLVTPNMCHKQ